MKNLRVIFVGLIAFSLAALPVAAGEMSASMTGGVSVAATHDHCCDETEPCEKQTKNDCDRSGACAVKCSLIPATTVAALDVAGPAPASTDAEPLVDHVISALEHPPLPPPRV